MIQINPLTGINRKKPWLLLDNLYKKLLVTPPFISQLEITISHTITKFPNKAHFMKTFGKFLQKIKIISKCKAKEVLRSMEVTCIKMEISAILVSILFILPQKIKKTISKKP
jgi:hypothetical protein